MADSGGKPLAGSTAPIEGRCGAQLQNSRPPRYCTMWPLKAKNRCKRHGGGSLAGFAHPNFRHGLCSNTLPRGMFQHVLPKGLGAHVETARQNPALLSLSEHVALVDGKVFELFEQLAAGEGPIAWSKALIAARVTQSALTDVHTAMLLPAGSANRGNQIAAALEALEVAITTNLQVATTGATLNETWGVITEQIYLRKKLVDSEVKRQKAAAEVILKSELLTLLGAISQSVQRHVSDTKARQGIVDDMRRLMAGSEQ